MVEGPVKWVVSRKASRSKSVESGKARLQPQLLLNDGDEHVKGDGNPDLGLHCVLTCAVESADSQVLFSAFDALQVPQR
jgi:hypothetical protein